MKTLCLDFGNTRMKAAIFENGNLIHALALNGDGIDQIKGIRVVKQAHAYWADRFEKRQDQYGRTYFWLTGEFSDLDQRPDTDLHALKAGYVSIVPTQFDLTAYAHIQSLKTWEHEAKSE